MPGGEGRTAIAPVEVGKAEVEIGEAAADGDVTDAEARRGEVSCLMLQVVERGAGLQGEAGEQFRQLPSFRLVAFVAPENEDVEQAIAERVPGQGRPALPA